MQRCKKTMIPFAFVFRVVLDLGNISPQGYFQRYL